MITSAAGQLNVTLDLGMVDYVGPIHSLRTRALGGRIPGPTLKIRAGDTLRVRFRNRLRFQRSADGPERPDVSNLHFHGLHTGSALPGDDTTLPVGPRAEYTYVIEIPPDHAPGTFWIHPVHGSSATGGGGAVVDDPPGSRGASRGGARTRVGGAALCHRRAVQCGQDVGRERFVVGPNTFNWADPEEDEGGVDGSAMREDFTLVNGMFEPVLTVAPGEWTRWRLIYPGQQAHPAQALDLAVAAPNIGCEMQLLAKDGIYLADAPRQISQARVPAGGRADVMVRCSTAGTADVTSKTARRPPAWRAARTSDLLPAWSPPRRLPRRPWRGGRRRRCRCSAHGRMWMSSACRATHHQRTAVARDRVPARRAAGRGGAHAGWAARHPYHHHMFPFQLTSSFNDEYFRRGGWHDTWQDAFRRGARHRFRPLDFTGRMPSTPLAAAPGRWHDGERARDEWDQRGRGLPSGAGAAPASLHARAGRAPDAAPDALCGRVECYVRRRRRRLVACQWERRHLPDRPLHERPLPGSRREPAVGTVPTSLLLSDASQRRTYGAAG